MAKGDNSPGVSKLAGTFQQLARQEYAAPPMLDFGVIQEDFSLLTNTYPIAIPPSDYLVCRTAALPNSEVITSYGTVAKNNSHTHDASEAVGSILDGQGLPCSAAGPVNVKSATVRQQEHDHEVDIARATQRHLQAGDRVLVAWVDNDAVVIDVIYTATRLKEMTEAGK